MSEVNSYKELHILFNSLPRLTYPYEKGNKNGVYVMFEKGEKYKGMDRIVRVGSHLGENRLFHRLNEHFAFPKQRQSIFRKHIGRCFLTRDKREDYIPIWDYDVKSIKDKERYYHLIDWALEKVLEERISQYLHQSFSFVVIPGITHFETRRRLEIGLIATLAQGEERCSSKKWLGNLHSNSKIRESKLWNINHHKASVLSMEELLKLNEYVMDSERANSPVDA